MSRLLQRIARHKAGDRGGVYAVCSAHPWVLESALGTAASNGAEFALIEATCNQVNPEGGYTGLTPSAFRDGVHAIADRVGLPRERVVLGGDHLGPHPWTSQPADEAMARAARMVESYVAAGFHKVHLDCSMPCADDPRVLEEAIIAQRATALCAVAERTALATGSQPPVYVIGTEVPAPGGAAEDLHGVQVTSADAVAATLATHESYFKAASLSEAWDRVIAVVVQPGVEFDGDQIVAYASESACALSRQIEAHPRLVYEAHSTDYQPRAALERLVADHFAILKVGPALSYALREALWALEALESDGAAAPASRLAARMITLMHADPSHWRGHYRTTGAALEESLQFSRSDRIRYYWSAPEAQMAVEQLMHNLARVPPPLEAIRQRLPAAHAAIESGRARLDAPRSWVCAQIAAVIEDYVYATNGTELAS